MFIGYYTIYGPTGHVQGPTRAAVEEEAKALLEKHPNALSGQPRRSWFGDDAVKWTTTVWSRIELVGN